MTVSAQRITRPLNVQARQSFEPQVMYEFGTFIVAAGSGSFTLARADMNHQCVFVIVHKNDYPATAPTFKFAARRGTTGGYLIRQQMVNGIYTTGVSFPIIGTMKGEVTNASSDGTYIYEVYYV